MGMQRPKRQHATLKPDDPPAEGPDKATMPELEEKYGDEELGPTPSAEDARRMAHEDAVGAMGQARSRRGDADARPTVAVTGNFSLGGSGEFMWALPSDGKDHQVVREFPPKVGPTDMTPNPAEVSFFLLPTAVVQAFQQEFGW
jgi:hypothetical protein